jgi:hypothetical protein
MHGIFTVDVVTCPPFLSKLFRDSDIILQTYTNRLQTINTRGPQHVVEEDCGVGVVVSTSIHGRYHHGSDHRMHDVA